MTWWLCCDRCGVMGMVDRPVAENGWIERDDKSHWCSKCRAIDMLERNRKPTKAKSAAVT